jgi:hypothetical protein
MANSYSHYKPNDFKTWADKSEDGMQIHKSFQLVFILGLSYLSLFALTYLFRIPGDKTVISNDLLSILFFILLFFFFRKIFKFFNLRLFKYSLIFGILLAIIQIFGAKLANSGNVNLNAWAIWFEIIISVPLFTVCTSYILYGIPILYKSISSFKLPIIDKLGSSKIFFFITWGAMLIPYFVALIICYPGSMNWDAAWQIQQFQEWNINIWHPVASTLLFGAFATFGINIFHSWNTVYFIYSIFQIVVFTGTLMYIIKILRQIKTPDFILLCIFLYYTFNYIIVSYSFVMTKDILFTVFFMLSLVEFLSISYNIKYLTTKRIIKIGLLIFLSLIFRHNMIYSLLIFIPFLFLFSKKEVRKKLFVTIAIPVMLFFIYTGPVYNIIGIKKFDSLHSMTDSQFKFFGKTRLLSQQLARVMRDNYDGLSDETRIKIAHFIPNYSEYNRFLSDPMGFKCTESEQKDFINLWVCIGLKFPETYINALLEHTYNAWYIGADVSRIWISKPEVGIRRDAMKRFLNEEMPMTDNQIRAMNFIFSVFIEKIHDNIVKQIPFLSLLLYPGIHFLLIILSIVVCIYCKKYSLMLPSILNLILLFTIFAGPVVNLRYLLPMLVSSPVILAILLSKVFYEHTDLAVSGTV